MKVSAQDSGPCVIQQSRPPDNTDTILPTVVCNTDIGAPHKEHYSQGPQTLWRP